MSWWEQASRDGWTAHCAQRFSGRSVPKTVDVALREIDERWATSLSRQQLHGEGWALRSALGSTPGVQRYSTMALYKGRLARW